MCRAPTSWAAPMEPTTAPPPMAAWRTPTPESPLPKTSKARTTLKTLRHPRVNVCAAVIPISKRASREAIVARSPSTASPINRRRAVETSAGGRSYGRRTIASAANTAATAAATNTVQTAAISTRAAASSGPTMTLTDSTIPRPMLDAASSSLVWHSDGSSAEWAAR